MTTHLKGELIQLYTIFSDAVSTTYMYHTRLKHAKDYSKVFGVWIALKSLDEVLKTHWNSMRFQKIFFP